MKTECEFAKDFILYAVKNKYSSSDDFIKDIVEKLFFGTAVADIEGVEKVLLKDLERQTKTLRILRGLDHHSAEFWKRSNPISEIHAMASGVDPANNLRSTRFVEDFGGDVPTHPDEVAIRLDELERLMTSLSKLRPQDSKVKATLLAHIYSSVIRIHPFQDGNGRVARFATLYLLTCWHTPPILIPKVRNSKVWQLALDAAIRGEIDDLTTVFLKEVNSVRSPKEEVDEL